MDVEEIRERDLPPDLAEEIRRLQQEAFPDTSEFARQRWYHTPPADDDLWLVARDADGPAASVRLITRRAATEYARPIVLGGVANVCSHPDRRGAGAASACMKAAAKRIAEETDFGLLFCGPEVSEFYARLGWRDVSNPLTVRYAGRRPRRRIERHPDEQEHAMMLPGRRPAEQWPGGTIDLKGPDW